MPEMTNPTLPGRVINVGERAVPYYRKSGWVLKDEHPAKPPAAAPVQPAGPVNPEQAKDPLNLSNKE